MKNLAIIIVNWNTKRMLRNCLNSIIEQTKEYSYEIYVVDNNSPDKSADMVTNEFPNVHLIANNKNKGFAAANNQALKIAEANNYLLLNPDTIVLENAIDKMMSFKENSNYDIITCKLLNSDGTLQKSVNSFYNFWQTIFENRMTNLLTSKINFNKTNLNSLWNHDSIKEIDWARGAVVLFSNKVLKTVGFLDEMFFIYGEEIDYFFRAKQFGFKSVFIPNAVIMHHGKASSKQKKSEMFIQNYKSFYLFLKKHYSVLSYFTYRTRVHFILISWVIYYTVAKILSPTNTKIVQQKDVYTKTLLWHFSKESLIKT